MHEGDDEKAIEAFEAAGIQELKDCPERAELRARVLFVPPRAMADWQEEFLFDLAAQLVRMAKGLEKVDAMGMHRMLYRVLMLLNDPADDPPLSDEAWESTKKRFLDAAFTLVHDHYDAELARLKSGAEANT